MTPAVAELSVPEAALTRWLSELPTCVILRNEADLVDNLGRGGDVDLLVGDLPLAERLLVRHMGPPVRIIRSSYVTGYAYDWGQIDLLPTLEWRGACYLEPGPVFEASRRSARGLPVPRIAHEAVISWLSSVLFGGFFNVRYAATIGRAVDEDGRVFRQVLRAAAGRTWGDRLWQAAVDRHPEISASWVRPLRRAVWWRAWLRAPLNTVRRAAAFVLAEVRLRIAPVVPSLAIVGPDDRQTSRVTDALVQHFARCPYGAVTAVRWLPRRGRRIPELAKWLVTYWTRWVHLRAKGYILAFEDPPLARTWPWLLPKPNLVFTLNPESDVQSRGLPASCPREAAGVRTRVRAASAVHVLNARLPPATVAHQVQHVVRTWMVDRASPSTAAASYGEGGRS